MKQINSALILYPNQLFAPDLLPEVDLVYVVEEPLYFGTDSELPKNLHKQKLVLHRASMRHYVEQVLWPHDINVEYIELHELQFTADILVRAKSAGAEQVIVFDPADSTIESRLTAALDGEIETPFELRILPSPSFLLKQTEVRDYLSENPDHSFADFYQWQRERFNILIDKNYKPVGGKWSYDTDAKALLSDQVTPGFNGYGDNDYVAEAKKWVEKHFAENYGSLESFFWPTTHDEAAHWLDNFLQDRLEDFATYDSALDKHDVLLYHSGIAASLNNGLLTPKQVVDSVLAQHQKSPVNIPSLELFIRQVIGWREYMRGCYVVRGVQLKKSTGISQKRALSSQWWDASTTIPPLDDAITKVLNSAYADSAERLMIIANLMLLCDITPADMYQWFSSLFIDAYDWVVTPNVYGVSELSDFAGMLTKAYISPSNVVLKVSHYQKDVWCDVWDGLYWDFVERHRAILAKNPHTKSAVKQLAKLDDNRRRIIGYRAQDFLTTIS